MTEATLREVLIINGRCLPCAEDEYCPDGCDCWCHDWCTSCQSDACDCDCEDEW